MRSNNRVDGAHADSESGKTRLLTVLLTVYENCGCERAQLVAVDELCGDCVLPTDLDRIRELRWIDIVEVDENRLLCVTALGESVYHKLIRTLPVETVSDDADCAPLPQWHAPDGQLVFAGQLLKRFEKHSPNQQLLLDSFEELNWPQRIDNPFSDGETISAAARMRETIKQLNRTLELRLIRFRADGTGTGVLWVPERVAD